MVRWQYDAGEPWAAKKHGWPKDFPGFVKRNGVTIAKCPSGFTQQRAENALNRGIGWSSRRHLGDWPEAIFAVVEGHVYKAQPTVRGLSYHGYPAKLRDLPPNRSLREKLLGLARADGSEAEVAKWLKGKR